MKEQSISSVKYWCHWLTWPAKGCWTATGAEISRALDCTNWCRGAWVRSTLCSLLPGDLHCPLRPQASNIRSGMQAIHFLTYSRKVTELKVKQKWDATWRFLVKWTQGASRSTLPPTPTSPLGLMPLVGKPHLTPSYI